MGFIEKDISRSGQDGLAVAPGNMRSMAASYGLQDTTAASNGSPYRHYAKRALDIALVLLAAPFWVPLVLIGALMVACDGHNPFYSQKRLGQNGRVFRIWKLRSMVPNADAILKIYLADHPEARAEWDATQKLKDDPRITTVGRILRKTSLDELPQLINVLIGDMSLVGPRPIMVNQRKLYPGKRYYDMRPGLTGFWQVSGRNDCSFLQRVSYDDDYHREMSFGTDVAILFRTVGVVLRGTGY